MDDYMLQKADVEAASCNVQSPKAHKQTLLDPPSPNVSLKAFFSDIDDEANQSPETSNTSNDMQNPEHSNKSLSEEKRSSGSQSPGSKSENSAERQPGYEQLEDKEEASELKSSLKRSFSQTSDQCLLLKNEVDEKPEDIDDKTLDEKQSSSSFEKVDQVHIAEKRQEDVNQSNTEQPITIFDMQTPKKALTSLDDVDLLNSEVSTNPSLPGSIVFNNKLKTQGSSRKDIEPVSEIDLLTTSGHKDNKLVLSEGDTLTVEEPEEEAHRRGDLCPIKEETEPSIRLDGEARSEYQQYEDIQLAKQREDSSYQRCSEQDANEFKKEGPYASSFLNRPSESKMNERGCPRKTERLRDYQKRKELKITKLKKLNRLYTEDNLFPREKGLPNKGNSCFRNAVLQVLLHALLFSEYFIKQKKLHPLSSFFQKLLLDRRGYPLNKDQETSFFRKIDTKMHQINNSLEPRRQHDAIEFMKTFLEVINEENNRVTTKPLYRQLNTTIENDENFEEKIREKSHEWYEYFLSRENSIVTDLFAGQILNITKCKVCKTKKISFDTYWDLTLGFKNHTSSRDVYSLMDMLKNFTKKDDFLGEGIYCDKCEKNCPSTYKSSIYKLPEILVIDFKRFKQEDGWEKIHNEIVFPVDKLDLSEVVKDSSDISVRDPVYSLFGVVNHTGTLESGHYTADCMNYMTGQWKRFDDAYVGRSNLGSSDLYKCSPSILFYVKASHLEDIKENYREGEHTNKRFSSGPIDLETQMRRSLRVNNQDVDFDDNAVDDDPFCGALKWICSLFQKKKEPSIKTEPSSSPSMNVKSYH